LSAAALFFSLTCLFALVSLCFLLCIVSRLSENGIDIDFINMRWKVNKYLKIYKELTNSEETEPACFYYLYLIFSYLSVLCFFIAIYTVVTDI